MAMVLHGFNRCTDTIEILVTADASARARNQFGVGTARVRLRLIAAGDKDISRANDLRFPDPRDVTVEREGFPVIAIPKLIELKLASGLHVAHRLRDLADVQDLIPALKLPRELGDQLDPSVRDGYFHMWDAAQTPDAHEQGG
jgi:hypothetical protein